MSNSIKGNNRENTPFFIKRNFAFTLYSSAIKQLYFTSRISFLLLNFVFFSCLSITYSQTSFQPNYLTSNQQNSNYLAKSTAFSQEIARMEIKVVRQGKAPMSITQVPRLQKDDVLKVRMLEEAVNGIKPDQSNWDWSFLIAYVNPARNNEKDKSVSQEIQFRKSGWYKEYSFTVPYDSQPIFFLYPKPKYRDKILSLINNKSEEIRKVGEKTLELAGAYAKIGSFLNELQYVINRSSYGRSSGYGNYGSYGGYGNYGSFGSTNNSVPYNYNALVEQSIERLARSFNIALPSCWNGGGYGSGSTLGSSYGNTYGGTYGSYGSTFGGIGNNNFGYAINQELIGRAQCVAKSVRLEDFDISVTRMLQQGGIMGATQLAQKYPQLIYWINLAAAAVDFIIKVFGKTPMRIVPSLVSSSDNQSQFYGSANNFSSTGYSNPSSNSAQSEPVKISLFAESQPNDNDFVTAYPLVVHKWQANPDPEVISLPMPVLMEPCLHAGQNILRSTDLLTDWMSDTYTRDFKLIISASNGFRKEFPLKKNLGMSGWELNLTKEDLNAFPKINMNLESVITGTRGFNEVESPKFDLSIPVSGAWEIESQSQKAFAVGDKRKVVLKNQLGNCRCLQAVVYKPSFGGQFVFEVNGKTNNLQFSADGKEVWFEVDATHFQAGQGQLELRQYGGEVTNINLNLYPQPPIITNVKISKGDNQAVITGERLEQMRALKINGKRAIVQGHNLGLTANNQNVAPSLLGTQSTPAFTANASGSSPGEKVVIFEDPNAKHLTDTFSLELELEDNRIYQYPKTFSVSPSRPAIVTNAPNEIEGIAIIGSMTGIGSSNKADSLNNKPNLQLALSQLPIFPIDTTEISVNVQNALTNYDFRAENIQIETRIENSQINSDDLPKASFEILNWMSMRVSFSLSERTQKLLGGKRLQFRIRDKVRGDSDWYTLRKTFVRVPEKISVKCTGEMNGNCEIKGEGIDYISQVSVDGGISWFPQGGMSTLVAQPTADGQRAAMIPHYSNKKLLRIKLIDLPKADGLIINDYNFINLARGKK